MSETITSSFPRDWVQLQTDILLRIATLLDWSVDIPRVRAVCNPWRNVFSIDALASFPFPQLQSRYNVSSLTLPLLRHSNKLYYVRLFETRNYLLSPPNSPTTNHYERWLVKVFVSANHSMHILNPCTSLNKYITTYPPVVAEFNLFDGKALELAKTMCLVSSNQNGRFVDEISYKVVGGWNSYRFTVVAVVGLHFNRPNELLLWRSNDKDWTHVNLGDSKRKILDVAFYRGKFYALEEVAWRVGILDPEDTTSVGSMEFTIDGPNVMKGVDGRLMVVVERNNTKYVVGQWCDIVRFLVSGNELYLVFHARNQVHEWDPIMMVYVLRERDGNNKYYWERVSSIGDRIFFVGKHSSFAVLSVTKNLPQWKPGSICVLNDVGCTVPDGQTKKSGRKFFEGTDCLESIVYSQNWKDFELFDMDEEERGIVCFKELLSSRVLTGMFFPPPSWVKWRCPSLADVEVRLDKIELETKVAPDQYLFNLDNTTPGKVDLSTAFTCLPDEDEHNGNPQSFPIR